MMPGLRRLATNGYLWIFLAAIALRGCYLWEAFRNNELIAYPLVDAQVYVEWARDILAGKWLWFDPMHYTPAVPAWIAGWTALLGWIPSVHFVVFHLIGAAQAIVLGKTAELVWDRRAGLATGWLAALYWPLILFEASYYAEPFAIWNLALALYLLIRWLHRGGSVWWLVWAGFHLGWSVLARANAILCLPILAGWLMWRVFQAAPARRWWRALAVGVALVLPPLLLCLPVAYWNWKIMGRPVLRTGGWLSVYLGNNPEYRGLVVPVGVRWTDFVYQPVRAGFTTDAPQEDYWRGEVLRVIRDRTGDWLRLLPRKAVMLAGRLEVSQEIDIPTFRQASRILSLPIWPGWGTLAPLALVTLCAMLRAGEARRGLLLALCAGAYLFSIVPVQISARYRLPTVVPLLPLAGWALSSLLESMRRGDRRTLTVAFAGIGAAGLLIWPDWLELGRAKLINHWFLVGLKRTNTGDENGSLAAFAAGATWNPADPDCPLRMAQIALHRGEISRARDLFAKSRENFPRGHDALLGFGECALAENHPDETLANVKEALLLAPNNLDAIDLASRAYAAEGNWTAMAMACRQMRSYLTYPASAPFSEAWAWVQAGRTDAALQTYDGIAATRRFSTADRSRALFLAGALAWSGEQNRPEAVRRWTLAAKAPPNFFQPLADMLVGGTSEEATLDSLPGNLEGRPAQYVAYARGLKAWCDGRPDDAARHFEQIVKTRDARKLRPQQLDIIELMALQGLAKLPPQ